MIPIALTAPALFVAGATTSLHCALMCGAVNAAQSRSHGPVPLPQALGLVHAGRVLGYALLGTLAGALGARLALWLPPTLAGRGLQVLAALTLIGAGVQQLAGHRRATHIKDCCARPVAAPRLPPRARLLAQGLLWALMPCGILYAVLLLAALTSDALAGFVLLAAFGLGTVPLLATSGGLLGLAMRRHGRPQDARSLRRAAGSVLIVLGLAGAGAALAQPDSPLRTWCAPVGT